MPWQTRCSLSGSHACTPYTERLPATIAPQKSKNPTRRRRTSKAATHRGHDASVHTTTASVPRQVHARCNEASHVMVLRASASSAMGASRSVGTRSAVLEVHHVEKKLRALTKPSIRQQHVPRIYNGRLWLSCTCHRMNITKDSIAKDSIATGCSVSTADSVFLVNFPCFFKRLPLYIY